MRKLTFVVLGVLLLINSTFGQDPKDRFKGLYIFNLTKLIDWPQEYKSGDFVITILGESNVNEGFEGKQVISQPIVSKKISSLEGLGRSHILFIPTSQSDQLGEALKKLKGTPTVIITDKPGLLDKGSYINFIMKDGKLGIEINKTTMERYGLKVSSDLSSLASKVK